RIRGVIGALMTPYGAENRMPSSAAQARGNPAKLEWRPEKSTSQAAARFVVVTDSAIGRGKPVSRVGLATDGEISSHHFSEPGLSLGRHQPLDKDPKVIVEADIARELH